MTPGGRAAGAGVTGHDPRAAADGLGPRAAADGLGPRAAADGLGPRAAADGLGPRAAAILDRVRAIPEGFVRTYGDISPGAPRVAGAVLSQSDDAELPWHRVVRADGSLAKGRRQARLLRAEGVPFRGERVDLRVARVPG